MEFQAQLSPCQTLLPDGKPSKHIPKRRGIWAPAYLSTEQHFHGVNYNRGSASQRGLPEKANSIQDSSKNDRDGNTLTTGHTLRVHGFQVVDSRDNWTPTNQIRALSARAHLSRELRARALLASRGI